MRHFRAHSVHRSVNRLCYHLEGDFFLGKSWKKSRSNYFFRARNIYFGKRSTVLEHFCKENKQRPKQGPCRIIPVLADWCIAVSSTAYRVRYVCDVPTLLLEGSNTPRYHRKHYRDRPAGVSWCSVFGCWTSNVSVPACQCVTAC